MARALWERLRAAKGAEVLALLALAALLALLLLGNGTKPVSGHTELEARLARILSRVDGAGEVEVMVNEDGEGGVTGAVIVSSGKENVMTFLNLENAVTTLLEIDAARVEIIFAGGMGG